MNPCEMEWKFRTSGVIFEGDSVIIPYAKPKPDHLPLSEEVLISKSFELPKNITVGVEISKEQLSQDLPKRKWYEFAMYIADDIVTWQGREIGFRFPLDVPKNNFTCYIQRPILVWEHHITDKKIDGTDINQITKYSIIFEKVCLNLYRVKYVIYNPTIPQQTRSMYVWLPNKTFNLAFISHNWSKLEAQHLYMKIHDVKIEG